MSIQFKLNGKDVSVQAPPDARLLWVIREELKLTGTKFGCGAGLCGACMVHIDGKRAFSCQTRCRRSAGKSVTTIEGLSPNSSHPRAEGLARRAGAAMRLLPIRPDHERRRSAGAQPAARRATQIVEHMSTNICRCGTYPRIVRAIERAAREA